MRKYNDPSADVASTVLRVTVNDSPSAFYGEKYQVDKVGAHTRFASLPSAQPTLVNKRCSRIPANSHPGSHQPRTIHSAVDSSCMVCVFFCSRRRRLMRATTGVVSSHLTVCQL